MAPGRRNMDRSPINPCLKYFLFFFNFVFLIVGIATVSLSAWVIDQKEKSIKNFLDVLMDPAMLFCIGGCIMIIISFFGCFGSLRENTCMLSTYTYSVSFFLFIQVAAIIFVFIFYLDNSVLVRLNIYPEDFFKDAIKKYREDPDTQDLIDGWQQGMDCCGFSNDDEGYKAWNENEYFNCSSDLNGAEKCAVPWSCCIIKEGDAVNLLCGADALKSPPPANLANQINRKGCLKGLRDWIESNTFILACSLIGLIVPQMLMICFAKSLREQIFAQKSKWNYQ